MTKLLIPGKLYKTNMHVLFVGPRKSDNGYVNEIVELKSDVDILMYAYDEVWKSRDQVSYGAFFLWQGRIVWNCWETESPIKIEECRQDMYDTYVFTRVGR